MLTVTPLGRRAAWPSWISQSRWLRSFSRSEKGSKSGRDQGRRERGEKLEQSDNGRSHSDDSEKPKDPEVKKPSLVEELFPEETKRYEEAQAQPEREIPRLPLETAKPTKLFRKYLDNNKTFSKGVTWDGARLRADMQEQAHLQSTVLVLLKASKNLAREDFERLVPQGEHIEGWTLEKGEIVKVIPGRDMRTLERTGTYYLLFSSALSAFVYQGHVSRMARLVTEQTLNSLHSSILPPPGYMIDGMDAHAAMQAYALTPPNQRLTLRQLRPPVSPMVSHLIRNGGYAALLKRPDRMPFEVRLVLEGPQLPIPRIRYILYESGRDRALGWSGGNEMMVKISKWEPTQNFSSTRRDAVVERNARDRQEILEELQRNREENRPSSNPNLDRRTPPEVYILGFHTELAAQTFVHYWHRRPMEWGDGNGQIENDSAPIANVEMLW